MGQIIDWRLILDVGLALLMFAGACMGMAMCMACLGRR